MAGDEGWVDIAAIAAHTQVTKVGVARGSDWSDDSPSDDTAPSM